MCLGACTGTAAAQAGQFGAWQLAGAAQGIRANAASKAQEQQSDNLGTSGRGSWLARPKVPHRRHASPSLQPSMGQVCALPCRRCFWLSPSIGQVTECSVSILCWGVPVQEGDDPGRTRHLLGAAVRHRGPYFKHCFPSATILRGDVSPTLCEVFLPNECTRCCSSVPVCALSEQAPQHFCFCSFLLCLALVCPCTCRRGGRHAGGQNWDVWRRCGCQWSDAPARTYDRALHGELLSSQL